MYKIVADVSRYQEFVPFVEESFINSKDEATSSPTEAGLRVGWKQFDEKFTCKLICTEDESVIAESITHLLFDKLHTQWTFKELKNPHIKTPSCEVQLDLVYSFKNPLYNTVTSMFSEQVAKVLMKAFEKRARDLKMKELKHR